MEERLPKLSDLSFCIFHITSLWLCPACHEILCPIQPFLSLGWLWGISSLLGTTFRVWFCHWSWTSPWEECGDSLAESIWGALGLQALSHLLQVLALFLWTLQPSGLLCDFTISFNNFLKFALFLTRYLGYFLKHHLSLNKKCLITSK